MKTKNKKQKTGFTLVEIMIVVAIISLLAAASILSYASARERSQSSVCVNNLRLIDGGKTQYALEYGAAPTDITDLVPEFVKRMPYCPSGGTYDSGGISGHATCTIGGTHVH